jgi:hypothetical protein
MKAGEVSEERIGITRIIINAAEWGMRNEVAKTSFRVLSPITVGNRALLPNDNVLFSAVYI